MKVEKKIRILMISSNSDLGGGPNQMFMLGENLSNIFEIYYALPKNSNFSMFLNSKNHIEIAERKICLMDIFNLNKFIKKNNVDIIHAHGKGAGVIARFTNLLNKKKLIYTFHGIHVECHSFLTNLIYLYYENIFGRIDNYKIFVSESEKKYAKKLNIFMGPKMTVINNGVSNKLNKDSSKYQEIYQKKNSSSKITVVSTCRFVKQKNIKDIIRIAKKIPEIDFKIIGYGKLWRDINQYILEMGVKNVYLIGLKKNVFRYLCLADIYLSTSLYEGMPLSILEAMSVGLPIVASNVVGNLDTIENGKTGYLYDLNNIDSAIRYIKKLAFDKSHRTKIGNNSFLRQRKFFSKLQMLSNYENLYKKVAGEF